MKLQNIGERLKWSRKLLGINREYLCDKYNISIHTYGAWERSSEKISDHALNTVTNILQQEGLNVTKDWLLEGIGTNPNTKYAQNIFTEKHSLDLKGAFDPGLNIEKEKDFFLQSNEKSVVIQNRGSEMSPFYESDEWIGGVKKEPNQFELISGLDCIVLISGMNTPIFKRLIINNNDDINLHILNPYCENKPPVIFSVNLIWAAPVIWRRKIDRFSS